MKIKRQSKLVELVQNESIETQDDLTRRLSDEGFDVTQATVSRDIHELNLIKVATADGRQKYSLLSSVISRFDERLLTIFRNSVTSVDYAQNMVVVRTFEGMAMAVGACIDAMGFAEVLGSIAGDDTIFCLTRDVEAAVVIIERLKGILKKNENDDDLLGYEG